MIVRDRDAKQIAEFERDNNLFDRSYAGFYYWQYVRFQIFDSIYDKNRYRKDLVVKSKKKQRLKLLTLFRKAIRDRRYFKELQQAEMLCLAPNSEENGNGDYYRFYSLFDICPTAKKKYLWTDWFNAEGGLDISLPMLKCNIEYHVRKKINCIKRDIEEESEIRNIHNRICNYFGDCISVEEILDIIQKQIYINKYLEPFYRKVIEKTACKIITLITYYDILQYPIYDVAREKKIPIVEFQHGCIANHYAYCLLDDNCKVKVPDYFLTFGIAQEGFTNLLSRTKVVPVGYHYHNTQIQNVNDIETDDKMIIVYPEECDGFEECISNIANELSNEGYRVALKIYPGEIPYYRKVYSLLVKNKNIRVYTNEFNNNIYHYLKMAKHHIVINTTVGLQAAGFRHTNICVCTLKRHDTNQCLIENGVARGFRNAKELKSLLLNPLDCNKMYSRQLFEENAKEKIVSFFEQLLEANRE